MIKRFSTRLALVVMLVVGLGWGAAVVPLLYSGEDVAGSGRNSHIIYVNAAAPPGGDGGSWADAFTDLQDALAAAQPGDEIWVAAGVYKPTDNPTDSEASFHLVDGVAVYGGFAAWETSRDQRDWETNITVLSGDIDGNDLTDPNGVVTDTDNIVGANSYHVVVGSGVTGTAVLDGFTITAGQANGVDNINTVGGGMLNENGSPSLSNLIFSANYAEFNGGGMSNEQGSNPTLTNVVFNNNQTIFSGGGLFNHASSPILNNVVFNGNISGYAGGGMGNEQNSSPTLTNVVFNDNHAILNNGFGGAMTNSYSASTLTDVIFSENSGTWGGALANYNSNITLVNSLFQGNYASSFGGGIYNEMSSPTLVGVIFEDNHAGWYGGGMLNYDDSHPSLVDVTFTGNSAVYLGGGMSNGENGNPILTNVAFSGNSAAAGGGMDNWHSHPTLTNVVFEGNTVFWEDGSYGGGMNNWHSHPQLTNVLFKGNKATLGGGMANYNSSPTLTNAVFSGNQAELVGGGLYNEDDSNPLIQNSVFWHNQNETIHNYEPQWGFEVESIPIIRYSLVQGCNPGGEWLTACGEDGGGNLPDADPLFIETPDPADAPTTAGNLRLQPGSPAIDAGNNDYVAGVLTDLDGNPRVMGTAVDLGPYEFGSCTAVGALCVNWAATGANDGGSWADAFTDLQDALAAAQPGDEIWVAAGVYKPTNNPTDREASFYLVDGVAVYGGFAAWETSRNQRDWETNVTVLSGDIDDNDLTDPTGVVTNTANIVGANSYHVVVGSGVTGTAVLDGFTLTAGQAEGLFPVGVPAGGGIFNESGSPSLSNLIVSGNSASFGGGGMYNENSSPTLINVTFNGNNAAGDLFGVNHQNRLALTSIFFFCEADLPDPPPSGFGGAMLNSDNSSPILHNVLFSDNNAANFGGGMVNDYNSSPTLTDVVFHNNSAVYYGGGLVNANSSPTLANVTFNENSAACGGGMTNWVSAPTLSHVVFDNNNASVGGGGMVEIESGSDLANVSFHNNSAGVYGGGLLNWQSDPTLTDVVFDSNEVSEGIGGGMYNYDSQPSVVNALFSGNAAFEAGGGIANQISNPVLTNVVFSGNSALGGGGMANVGSNPILTNATFSGNLADGEGGGMYNLADSAPIIRNAIFWHNQDQHGLGTATASIYNELGSPLISYSLIQGCNPGGEWLTACGEDGGGNLPDADPLFIETPDPADAPTTARNLRLQPGSPAIDAGNNDYVAGVLTDLDGNPRIFGAAVDLGPYENQDATYTLTVIVTGQGTVTVDPDESSYDYGTMVTLTAASDPGWSFAQWSGSINSSDNPLNLTMDGHKTIAAVFANLPPTAHAGPDQTTEVNQPVTLNGGGSYDDDPSQTLTYGWAQTGGTPVTLSDSTAVTPTFTAPGVPAVLTFTLVVTDNYGLPSLPDSVTITVVDEPVAGLTAVNSGPTALDQITFFTATVSAGSNVSFAWDFGDGQTGGGPLVQHIYGATGVYTAVVTATNSINSLTTATIVVIGNEAPVAHAGADQVTEVNQIVALDASGSFDPDAHLPLTYGWTQTGGPPVTLSDSAAISPTFTAPAVGAVLTFTLVVTDSYGLPSLPDSVTVTLLPPQLLIAVTADKETAAVGETITYSYLITNRGDLPLSQIDPVDDLLGPLFTAPISLTVGAAVSQTLTYIVSEGDLPGPLVNTVVVSGTTPLGNTAVSQDSATVNLTSQPGLQASLTVSAASARPGERITYTLTLTNSGDVTLSDLSSMATIPGGFALPATLAPGEMVSVSYSYLVTAADLPGPLLNEVTVTAVPLVGDPISMAMAATTAVEPHRLFLPLILRP